MLRCASHRLVKNGPVRGLSFSPTGRVASIEGSPLHRELELQVGAATQPFEDSHKYNGGELLAPLTRSYVFAERLGEETRVSGGFRS